MSKFAASRVSQVSMYEEEDVERRISELRRSWQNTYSHTGKEEPSEEQLRMWAEEQLTEEVRREEVLKSLEAEIAASDAEALAYWSSPEMVAARAKLAAEKGEKSLE